MKKAQYMTMWKNETYHIELDYALNMDEALTKKNKNTDQSVTWNKKDGTGKDFQNCLELAISDCPGCGGFWFFIINIKARQ